MDDGIEERLGYRFRNRRLLERALTLASASERNNQKMECFGDTVMEMIVTEKLYFECPDEKEMTVRRACVVSDEALAKVSVSLGLDAAMIRGKGDDRNKKAVPSAYEAVVAAIYLDGGLDAARGFVLSTLDFEAEKAEKDVKNRLQEFLQTRGEPLPEYSHVDLGNPQNPDFEACVEVLGKRYHGRGESVKAAEKDAARSAVEALGIDSQRD